MRFYVCRFKGSHCLEAVMFCLRNGSRVTRCFLKRILRQNTTVEDISKNRSDAGLLGKKSNTPVFHSTPILVNKAVKGSFLSPDPYS